jgi:hypothetical protein
MGYADWLWSITKGLKNELGKFKLSETNAAVFARALQQLAGAYDQHVAQAKAQKAQALQQPTSKAAPPAYDFKWPTAAKETTGQGAGYQIPAGEDAGPIGKQQPAERAAETATRAPASSGATPISIAVNVLTTLLDLDLGNQPNMTFLAVSTEGFAPDTVGEATDHFVTTTGLNRKQVWGLSPPALLSTVLVDTRDLSSVGTSVSRGINVGDLQKNLQFLDSRGL